MTENNTLDITETLKNGTGLSVIRFPSRHLGLRLRLWTRRLFQRSSSVVGVISPARPLYKAFVSYSHAADAALASALQAALQGFAKPLYKLRAMRLFRDEASLPMTPALWSSIQTALDASEYLVLLASVESSQSHWVKREVEHWLEHRSVDKLFIVVTGTSPLLPNDAALSFAWISKNLLPPTLAQKFAEEPLFLDMRWAKRDETLSLRNPRFLEQIAGLSAGLTGRPKDELIGENVTQLRRVQRLTWAAITGLAALTLLSLHQCNAALENEGIALKNEGISLTALSDAALKDHPVDAAQLALAAWPRKGDEKRPQMRRVITALVSATSEYRERVRLEVPNAVRYAGFSPDGKRVITASEDNKAHIWDADTGEHLTSLTGHDKPVWSAVFGSDGARALTASDDGTARIWNVETGELLVVLNGHGARLRRAAFSLDNARIVTASKDSTARIWDAKTGKQLVELRGHDDEVYSAAFSPDGERIVTASLDKTARIWDAKTGKQLVKSLKHRDEVYSAAFSRDGARIVTASADGTVGIWNAKTGQADGHLTTDYKKNKFSSAAFSADGRRIVTASYDFRVRMWDVSTKKVLIEFKGHDDVVNFAAFNADGTKIVTASDDKTARIWDTAAAPLVAVDHEDQVNRVAFSSDGMRIVTASRVGTARIWNARTGALLTTIPGRKGAFKGDLGAMVTATFDPQGDRVVTASDYAAVVWNAKTGAPLITLDQQKWFLSAAFSPDGSRIVTSAEDKFARIWDAKTGEQVQELEHPDQVTFAEFSRPDGARIVTASADNMARIWNAETGKQLVELRGHDDSLTGAAFSPDGASIVTASKDSTARVWKASTGEVSAVLKGGHLQTVWSAAFNPDGTRIVTASGDAARIWDAKTGQLLAVLNAQGGDVFDAVFSPDGAQLATASEDGTARIWNIEISDAFTVACDRLGNKGNLTGLARRYGLTELKPICGSNAPIKAGFSNMLE